MGAYFIILEAVWYFHKTETWKRFVTVIIVIKTQHNEPRTSSAFLSGIRKLEIIFAFHFLSEGTSFSNKELLQVHKKVQRSGGKMDRGHKSCLQEGKRAFKHREGWITLLILGDVHVIIL